MRNSLQLKNRDELIEILEGLARSLATEIQPAGAVNLGKGSFLFGNLRYDEQRCVGCGACALNCPANAIELTEKAHFRAFNHLHQRCIACARCVETCPEEALELLDELDLFKALNPTPEEKMKTELLICRGCKRDFIPTLQTRRMERRAEEKGFKLPEITLCPACTRKSKAWELFPFLIKQEGVN